MNKIITVKSKKDVKNGVNAEGPWTLTILQDQDNVEFSTFKGNVYQVGQTYEIVYTEEQVGQHIRRAITSAIPKTNLAELPIQPTKFEKPIATQNAEKMIKLLENIYALEKRNNEILETMAPNVPHTKLPNAEDLPF